MRDGETLLADVHLPDGPLPQPAVLLRTPYDRALFVEEAQALLAAGYVLVVQSVRGRHGSSGTWHPYVAEGEDGFDSVEWVASQPWCDGRVGMIGASYGGWTQWAAARLQPPSLRTFVSSVACARWTGEWPWVDGVLWPGAITWLHMTAGAEDVDLTGVDVDGPPPWPLRRFQERYPQRLPQADEWLRHPRPDAHWAPITLGPQDFASVDLPVLHVTGWFDGCQRGSHFLFEGMRAHSPAADRQQLLVGPWDHAVRAMRRSYDDVDFGPDAVVDYYAERVAWLDEHLRGTSGPVRPTVRAFMTGADRWVALPDLPVPDATTRSWHLAGDGTLADTATGEPRGFVYDPTDPVVTRPPNQPASYPLLERSGVHARPDVLCWESPVLADVLLLAGEVRAHLVLDSDVSDTDAFVEIVDLAPDGTRLLVAHGRLRARYRDGLDREVPLVPGEPAALTVTCVPRVHRFAAGHRVVVAVTSSGAPLWAPHPNGAGDLWDVDTPQVARTRVHPASRVVLPVLP